MGIWILSFGVWQRSYAAVSPWGITETNIDTTVLINSIQHLTEINSNQKNEIIALEKRGIDGAYPRVTVTVAENFLAFAKEDIEHHDPARALYTVRTLDQLLQDNRKLLDKLGSLNTPPKPVPHYITSPRKIQEYSFYATTKTFNGKKAYRPVFFTGYGHFAQVRADLEKFSGYGTDLIQIEIGPQFILNTESTINTAEINNFLSVADRAAKSNVGIDLLLSPHYWPDWVKSKYPNLHECGGMAFCIDAPESKKILSDYFKALLPRIKDCPALFSICLTNEPRYFMFDSMNEQVIKCPYTVQAWKTWLQKTHRNIQTLNARYQSEYKSFSEVPIPPFKPAPTPRYYDWCRFNAERFAAWHQWMAGEVRRLAPKVPIHAKESVLLAVTDRGRLHWGVEPELFAELSDINGNDDYKFYYPNETYLTSWWQENLDYDFLASVAKKPIFNSENHIIGDRDLGLVPPEHVRNVLWQGAIHGQGATTIWVWERTFDPNHDFAGSIMHRPDCARMVGITNLDLQKFAREITAINQADPKYVILHSYSSLVYSQEYLDAFYKIYETLNSSGLRVGFVTERQLAVNKLAPDKILIIPNAPNLTDAAYRGLQQFIKQGGKIIGISKLPKTLITANEYQQHRSKPIPLWKWFDISLSKEELLDKFHASFKQVHKDSPIKVVDSQTGKPIIGIEYLSAKVGDHWVVNLSNYLKIDKTVIVTYNHQPMKCKNLFTDEQLNTITIPPLDPVLFQLKPQDCLSP
ncbi:MAG: beta-galactosidase [bacterium]